eukprot:11174090-Lingulodinium_polyedra.AAC.1
MATRAPNLYCMYHTADKPGDPSSMCRVSRGRSSRAGAGPGWGRNAASPNPKAMQSKRSRVR